MNDKLYTEQHLNRWLAVDAERVPREKAALQMASGDRVERIVSYLSGILATRARILIAAGDTPGARDALCSSVFYESDLYERFYRGEKVNIEYINAGHFQTLLDAIASSDWAVVQRFARVFPSEFAKESRSTPASIYIAQPLKALAEGRLEDARRLLARPEPKPDPMFRGYADCLRAIADKDMDRFMDALRTAAKHWRKWAARAERGLPGSVCFLHGAGFAALAQRVIGQSVAGEVEDVPLELIGPV